MGRGLTVSGTTGNVTASGGTLGVHKTGLPNAFNVLKFKSVPSAGSGASTIQVMQKDTLTTTDLVLEWKAASGNVYDPEDNSSGSPAEMPATDIIAAYDDEDLTGEFHMKFTNSDSVDKTYAYELTYEEVPIFDSSNVMTVSKAELLGDVLYFGGRTSGHISLRRSGTAFQSRLGDSSGFAGVEGSYILAAGNAVYLGGVTTADVLLTKSGGRFYINLGDNSASADVQLQNIYSSGGIIFFGGTTSTDALLKYVPGSHLLQIRKGDDSDFGDLQCGTLAPAFFSYNFGGLNGSIQYLDWSSTPQSLTVSDGMIF